MYTAPIPADDAGRVATLHSYDILDTPPEPGYEDVTALATHIFSAPYSTVTFVDTDRQWFKSEIGFGRNETNRSGNFCACAILQPETMVVQDTLLDARFADNLFVKSWPKIRFYAGAPIVAPNGHVLGTVCIFDIKPQQPGPAQIAALEALARQVMSLLQQRQTIKQLEEAIDEARMTTERLRMSQRTGRMASWEWEFATGRFIWNEGSEWTYGRPPSEMTKMDVIYSYLHEDDRAKVQEDLKPALEGWGIYRSEFRVIWPDGSLHWLEGFGRATLSPEGKPVGIVGINMDVTDRKLAEAALLQAEKLAAVGRLASSIAHEINNPLEAVTNLLYLANSSEDLEEIHTYLTSADKELRRTSAIASQTLRFHRQASRATAVSCEDLISSVLGVHHSRIMNAQVTVEKRKRACLPVVCFDGEVRQVLSNLVGNAIDAMGGTGGRLLIRSREGHDWKTGRKGLVITVADTGAGMSRDTTAKVFQAFFTTKGIGGTGLGLWISKEIVDRHRGKIWVRSSERKGLSGTVFVVFLPFEAVER